MCWHMSPDTWTKLVAEYGERKAEETRMAAKRAAYDTAVAAKNFYVGERTFHAAIAEALTPREVVEEVAPPARVKARELVDA